MASMTPGDVNAFLHETRIGKLSYLHPDGQPTIVPIWFEWDERERSTGLSGSSKSRTSTWTASKRPGSGGRSTELHGLERSGPK
jgi:nitroimidazol reductase NimA-like FMN-containing flavoprotein (pyridoxamine 5'-phosphate oxidase superfamily)